MLDRDFGWRYKGASTHFLKLLGNITHGKASVTIWKMKMKR